jgi:hypothetical protein
MRQRIFKFSIGFVLLSSFSIAIAPAHQRIGPLGLQVEQSQDAWSKLPFTAREWARQSLLPYRRIPLKNGGAMSVQDAYDLYLKAGQPEYPDMDTPGLVTPEEVAHQVHLSKSYNSS